MKPLILCLKKLFHFNVDDEDTCTASELAGWGIIMISFTVAGMLLVSTLFHERELPPRDQFPRAYQTVKATDRHMECYRCHSGGRP